MTSAAQGHLRRFGACLLLVLLPTFVVVNFILVGWFGGHPKAFALDVVAAIVIFVLVRWLRPHKPEPDDTTPIVDGR
jgi:hypothetical protein